MIDKIVSIAITAFVVTGVGIALRPGAPTANVIEAAFKGLARSQTAAFGPS